MLRATLKGLLARKLRLVLSGLAVVLGVMFVSGALVLTDSIASTYERVIASAYDDVEVVVTGEELQPELGPATAPIPVEVVADLRAMPEVDEAYAEIWAEGARVVGEDGQVVSTFSAQLGTNWLDAWLDAGGIVEVRDGRGPQADDEVAINAALARAGDIEVGDVVGVLTLEPRREMTVVGIFGHVGGRDSLFGETHVAFTDPVAQELLLGEPDVYSEVSLSAVDGVSASELRDLVAVGPGDGYVVQTGAEAADAQGEQIRDELSFLSEILLAFAGAALFVGVFLILNTFSIVVAQRMRELALLRALGASRRQVVWSVLVEAIVIGLVASTVGLGLGIGVGALVANLFSGEVQSDTLFTVPTSAIVGAYVVGLGVTVVAALVPALRASRVPPVAALQTSLTPERPLMRLTVAGVIGTAIGATLIVASLLGQVTPATVPMLTGGVTAAFIGVVLLTPVLARPVTSVLGRALAWAIPGELGRRNTGRNPRRTAVTAAALMVGVALVTAVSTFLSSFAASLSDTVEAHLGAEFVIAGESDGFTVPTFHRTVPDRVRDLDGVRGVAAFWTDQVAIDGEVVAIRAVDDLPAWREMTGVAVVDGGDGQLGSGQMAVDERTAERQQLAIGDTVTMAFPRGGEQAIEVATIYARNDVFEGPVLSAQELTDLEAPNPTDGYVALDDDADPTAVRGALESLLADSPEAVVHDRSGFVEQQAREFDEAIVFVQMMLLLAMIIAVLGVVNTMVLSIIERTRELGLLRALGLGRAAMARMVAVESVIISVFGALLGVVIGAGLGAIVVQVLRDEGFARLTLPWGLMVGYLVAAGVVGVLASLIPAIRAARLDVLTAISYE